MTTFEIRLPKTGIEPGDEGHRDHRLDQGQLDAEERQHDRQIERGQRRVQRGDPDLREDDVAKSFAKAGGAIGERLRKRPVVAGGSAWRKAMSAPMTMPISDPHQDPRSFLAERLHGGEVLLEPRHDAALQSLGIGRKRVDEPGRKQAAPALDHVGRLLQQQDIAARVAAKEEQGSECRQAEQAHDDGGDERDRDDPGALRSRHEVQAHRQHVHQLEDQQSGQQRRQEIEAQDEPEQDRRDDPRADHVVARGLPDGEVHGFERSPLLRARRRCDQSSGFGLTTSARPSPVTPPEMPPSAAPAAAPSGPATAPTDAPTRAPALTPTPVASLCSLGAPPSVGIEVLGDFLPRQATGDGAHDAAGDRAERAGHRSHRRARQGAARGADTRTHRMGAGRVGDEVAVLGVVPGHSRSSHC